MLAVAVSVGLDESVVGEEGVGLAVDALDARFDQSGDLKLKIMIIKMLDVRIIITR
jgi:hypothetical protein